MHRRVVGIFLAALFALSGLSACALPFTSASAPAPLAAHGEAPAGWNVYHGDHFAIAYPAGWSYSTPAIADGGQTVVVVLNGPKPRDQIEVTELLIVPQNAAPCASGRAQVVMLAGLPMRYEVVEGVHRVWSYFTSAHISYALSALDADQPTAVQAQHDAILATFRPDDQASGCP